MAIEKDQPKQEKYKRIGQLLLDKKMINEHQLEQALEEQKLTGKLLGRIFVDMGVVKEDDILQLLGARSGFSVIKLKDMKIPREVIDKVPASVAKIYTIMPISAEGNQLSIAIADPLNVAAFDDLRFTLGMNIKGVVASDEEIKEQIQRYYGSEGETIQDVLGVFGEKMELAPVGEEVNDIATLQELASRAPVIKLLNMILLQGVKEKASDIHFEPFEQDYRIRYRVDGVLYEVARPPKNLSLGLSSRIKVMANLDIAERRLPQDGRIMVTIEGKSVDLRISTLPTIFGESVVMRVLDRTTVSLSIDEVGMLDDTKKKIRSIIQKPNGIFLATGPTGCGKTTTLYGCMKEINKIEYKVITTEDPVEYDLKGVIQVPINAKIGLTFASSLRHILRQDPDIIMVGEIRDADTAQIAIQASLTGHLVFSTLHTNDAAGTITRLVDMGVEPFLVTSTLEAVLAQRLVRKICTFCKEEYTPEPEIIEDLGIKPEEIKSHKFYKGAGCVKCNNSGYKGRTGIYELLILNENIRQLVIERAHTALIKNAAVEAGMKTLLQDGLEKINAGITSVEEVLKEAQTSVL
ncbi:MAG TPA: type II secretion system ATPase GspE [Candidatus Omnitrophota bacterium]|nr:type II secretion system ATPase GspE [Candidatus Omnitrophota bacterium]HOX09003.1 type II secretion system ATPase GspE [Candidatus Omnitrophota bacterium]